MQDEQFKSLDQTKEHCSICQIGVLRRSVQSDCDLLQPQLQAPDQQVMGVNELWSILEPVRESVPLYSLVGKTLAVDLSLWVCEAQSVKEMMGRVTKPYLRNLFFRVSTLTLMGIKLIFVMEGEAPKIKAETMSRRTQLRFGGSKKQVFKQSKPNRSHFKFVLKECAEMLDCLGVPWVTATGEAEAMCAFLDSSGLVDGCITNDGDIFLYGGQTVYRNFSMNTKDPQVDCYKMQRVQSELHLDRETLVGVAILLGCDYMPKGIAGVGKEQTLKLVETLKGKTLLQKFNEWEDEGQVTQEKSVKKVTHCHVCHHPGTAKSHEHSGCQLCNSKRFCEPQDYKYCCPCEWHLAEHSRQNSTVEFSVKRKTLASDRFPFTEIINEFLVPKDRKIENFTRRKPNLLLMQNFALDKMDWPKHYTSEKVLPLITYTEMINVKCGKKTTSQLHPIRIHKPRVRNGIASFEIIWKKPEHYIHGDSTPEECQGTVSTVEEQCLFRTAYPDIVDQFTSKNAEAKENKYKYQKLKNRKMNRLQESEEISELFTLMNLHSSCEDKISSTSEMKIMLHSDITEWPSTIKRRGLNLLSARSTPPGYRGAGMENLTESNAYLDRDLDMVTSRVLSTWDWRTPDKCSRAPHRSPLSESPESSLESICSSPETPPTSGDLHGCALLAHSAQEIGVRLAAEKPPKAKMSTRRRMKASEREKMRMRSLADALHQLRHYLPPSYSERGQPLTKIQTLKYTIQYINELSELLKKT
ncbi:flap endonuclease GEN homolog 1 [Arapaima gigas]